MGKTSEVKRVKRVRKKRKKDDFRKEKRSILAIVVSFMFLFLSIYDVSTDFVYSNDVPTEEGGLTDMRLLSLSEIEERMMKDYDELYAKNNELIGMLNVPNVGYFPVMYSGDQKYINTNFDGEYEFKGVPFMNRNSFGRFEQNTLIHAHTMKDGSMFTSLRHYKEKDFFQNNDKIIIYDGKRFLYYEPFTILNIQDGKEFIQQKNLGDKNEEYLRSLMDRSLVKIDGYNPDLSKDALFLQTCDYNFYNSRLVLGSILVDEKIMKTDD